MVFDITHLKKIRKQLGLTQHAFAKQAGISQSMVAKIEAGTLDPTYSSVKKIEQAIDLLTKHQELAAKDIMHTKVITVLREERVNNVIRLLAAHAISQVPVVDQRGTVLGLLTESSLLEHPEHLAEQRAEDLMLDSPPIIAQTTPLSVIIQLLKFFPIVLVSKEGELRGVITKADILKKL